VPRSQSEVLARLYKDAAAKLKTVVLKPGGRTPESQAFNQAMAVQRASQIDRIVRDLNAGAVNWVRRPGTLKATVADARKLADRQAEEAGVRVAGSGVSGSFSLIDEGMVNLFAREIYADLSKASSSMGERAKKVLRDTAQKGLDESKINTILAGGAILGQPVAAIRQLREELRAVHGGTVRIISRNGNPIEFDVGYYAELVARTKTRDASVQARHQRLDELGMDLVEIVGRISGNFCTAFLGQVFSLSGRSTKYPAYSSLPGGGPPFHPNCTKSTRPFVEALAEPSQLDAAEPDADVGKLLGQDATAAQRMFKDLQLRQAAEQRYAHTEAKLFG
jgi:hypothetical protein